MTISGVGRALNVLSASSLDPTQAAGRVTNLLAASGTSPLDSPTGSGSTGTSSAQISGPGALLSKLQQLKTQDPAKFKQVLSDIATKLQTLAQQQGQNPSSQWLTKLADKFQTAANTGDLSALQPTAHQGHHHHHASGAAGAYAQNSADSSTLQQAVSNPGSTAAPNDLGSQLKGIFSEIDAALVH
jgi:hypothetical protein